MTTCILNPERGKGDPALPATGILAVNPSDAQLLAAYAQQYELKRSFLFNSTLYSSDSMFLAGPAVGAPMAVMCLEKLIVLGAKRIVVYGWCGSLQENLRAMDILVPTTGVSEEGTSGHYLINSGSAGIVSSKPLRSQVSALLEDADYDYKQGPLWTMDAPYRETEQKVADYSAQCIYGVDMEYCGLCAAAAFRGVELAAVMLVSDELTRKPWKPEYGYTTFKKRSRDLLTLLCDGVRSGAL
jgi:uridine phosphorylase